MRLLYHTPKAGETYKIISASSSLYRRFGKDLEIRIVGKAKEIFGDDFMNQSEKTVCRFYVTRLDKIKDSEEEVYLRVIGHDECLVNVSELDTTGKKVETKSR
jgi:hypothetical protein